MKIKYDISKLKLAFPLNEERNFQIDFLVIPQYLFKDRHYFLIHLWNTKTIKSSLLLLRIHTKVVLFMQMGINPEFIRKIRSNYDIINTCNQFTNLLVICFLPNYFKCSKEIIEDVVDQWVPLKINNQFGLALTHILGLPFNKTKELQKATHFGI